MVQSIPGKALFPGKHSLDQLTKVVTVMGPSEELGALEVAKTGAKKSLLTTHRLPPVTKMDFIFSSVFQVAPS